MNSELNTLKKFKCKFFGSRERKGQITQQTVFVAAYDSSVVEERLHSLGWVKINGLKIRECAE